MARFTFHKILERGVQEKKTPELTKKSRRWFRGKAKKAATSARQIWSERQRLKSLNLRRQILGNMYYFYYDAEWKDVLPYWDAFPLVIPIELTEDGFLGLNFHYLSPRLRANLLDRLMELKDLEEERLDWRKIRYDQLRSYSRYKYFKPCLKRYKFNNLRSRMIQLNMEEWDMALMLDVEQFEGAPKREVWRESRQMVRNDTRRRRRGK